MSEHFTDENWSDYVRGLFPAHEAAAIEQHIQKGCETCHQSLRLWRTVAEIASSEVRSEVPEDLVRASRAAYAGWRLQQLPKRAIMARLIFDSWLEPLPSGVRSGSAAPRRIVERAGQWSVDLRFEPAAGKRMLLMGQVLGSGQQVRTRANMPVVLMNTDALVAETLANEFGEFQMQFDQAKGLRIYVDVPGQRPIEIVLPDLDSPTAA